MTLAELNRARQRHWQWWGKRLAQVIAVASGIGALVAGAVSVRDSMAAVTATSWFYASHEYVDHAVGALASRIDQLGDHVSDIDLNQQKATLAGLKAQRLQLKALRPPVSSEDLDDSITELTRAVEKAQCLSDRRGRPWLSC